ncbi:MAG: hypothetical protein KBT47_05530, partial [Armatimonadetes bacterium]|nr:hypothetical protein [Candidatus Hippobium faecium]
MKKYIIKFISVIILITVASCVYGFRAEYKNIINAGENWDFTLFSDYKFKNSSDRITFIFEKKNKVAYYGT